MTSPSLDYRFSPSHDRLVVVFVRDEDAQTDDRPLRVASWDDVVGVRERLQADARPPADAWSRLVELWGEPTPLQLDRLAR